MLLSTLGLLNFLPCFHIGKTPFDSRRVKTSVLHVETGCSDGKQLVVSTGKRSVENGCYGWSRDYFERWEHSSQTSRF